MRCELPGWQPTRGLIQRLQMVQMAGGKPRCRVPPVSHDLGRQWVNISQPIELLQKIWWLRAELNHRHTDFQWEV